MLIVFFLAVKSTEAPTAPAVTAVQTEVVDSASTTQDNTTPTAQSDTAIENARVGNLNPEMTNELPRVDETKLKADTFVGTLEKVDVGCFADGECYVEVDGKHVTALMGWSQNTVGSVIGVEGFGDLESHIGEKVEVYAQDNSDGTYTLYGSEGFYIKLIDGATFEL